MFFILLLFGSHFFSVHADSSSLINMFSSNLYEQGKEDINRLKKLDNKVREYLKNKKFFDKNDIILQQKGQKLSNYLMLNEFLNECSKDNSNKRELHLRILDAAGKAEIKTFKCQDFQFLTSSFENQINQLTKISRKMESSFLFKNILDENIKNSVYAYTKVTHKLSSDDSSPKAISEYLCKDNALFFKKNLCSDTQKELIKIFSSQMHDHMKSNSDDNRLNEKDILKKLNNDINELNESLEEVNKKIKVKNGKINWFWWDSSDPEYDSVAENAYLNYRNSYLLKLGDIQGSLLASEYMQEKVGRLRGKTDEDKDDSLNEISDSDKNTTSYEFKKHKAVEKTSDISKSVDEVRKKIKAEFIKYNQIQDQYKKSSLQTQNRIEDKNMKKFIMHNPVSVGSVLINNPEYAPLVCENIKKIDKDDIISANNDKNIAIGGMVVGGILLASGIGSGIGAFLLQGAAASSTTLAGLTLLSAGLGLGLTATEVSYFGSKAYLTQKEIKEAEIAFLSGINDPKALKLSRLELEKYREYKFNSMLSLALGPLDLLGLEASVKLLKGVSETEKVRRLSLINNTLKSITENPALKKQFLNLTKFLGNEKAVTLIGQFSQLTTPKLLALLSGLNMIAKRLGKDKFLNLIDSLSETSNNLRIAILNKLIELNPDNQNLQKALAEAINFGISKNTLNQNELANLVNQFENHGFENVMDKVYHTKFDNDDTLSQLYKLYPLEILKQKTKQYESTGIFSPLYDQYKESKSYVTGIIEQLKKKFPKKNDSEIKKEFDELLSSCRI